MIEFIPYFAGVITLIFGVAFAYAITNTSKKDAELEKKIKESKL